MLAVTPEVNSRKSLSIPSLKITPFSRIKERMISGDSRAALPATRSWFAAVSGIDGLLQAAQAALGTASMLGAFPSRFRRPGRLLGVMQFQLWRRLGWRQ